MEIPQFAIDFIKKEEGLRLNAYKCPKGQPTIGYGVSFYPCEIEIENNGIKRKTKPEEAVKMGDKITLEQAEKILRTYLLKHCVGDVEDIEKAQGKLKECQIASILSVSFNVCNPKFKDSKCKRKIMSGDVAGACKEWSWALNMVKGRRNREIELFYGIKNFWK